MEQFAPPIPGESVAECPVPEDGETGLDIPGVIDFTSHEVDTPAGGGMLNLNSDVEHKLSGPTNCVNGFINRRGR